MCRPSRESKRFFTSNGRLVTCSASPPSTAIRHTCDVPDRVDRKNTVMPSGDQLRIVVACLGRGQAPKPAPVHPYQPKAGPSLVLLHVRGSDGEDDPLAVRGHASLRNPLHGEHVVDGEWVRCRINGGGGG